MRLIIIFIALVVIVMVIKRLWLTPGPAKNRQIPSNKMVQCAHCGLYTPEADAIAHGGKHYCSRAHLDEGNKDHHSSTSD